MNEKTIAPVAIIEPVGGHGGMNYYDFGLARGLAKAGQPVIVYTCEQTVIPDDLNFEVKTTFRGIWDTTNKIRRTVFFILSLFRSLLDAKRQGVKIIHYHFFNYTSLQLLFMKLGKLFGFKIVVTAHDVESFDDKKGVEYGRNLFLQGDAVIAHNQISKSELINKIKLPEDFVHVIPHGNYLDSITNPPSKQQARQALGLSESEKIILFFGQIKKVKGLGVLLDAMPEVIKNHSDVRLVIAGKVWKDDFSIYQKQIDEHHLADHIRAEIRYIGDDEVDAFYRSADVIVLPYLKIYQSGVLLMAMSYNIPVLVSDIPGMTEIIIDGDNGFCFKTEDHLSLGSKLTEILQSPARLAQVSNNGLDTVKQRFSWEAIGISSAQLYSGLSHDR